MPLSVSAINRLQMLSKEIAAEIPALDASRRAWVAVYPPVEYKPTTVIRDRREHAFLVKRFEIPKELVDEYFGSDSIYNLQQEEADGLEDVEAILASWGVDSSTLSAPWHCDYPL